MNRALAVILPLVLLLIISFSGMLYFGLTSGGLASSIKSFGEALKKITITLQTSQTKNPNGTFSNSTSTIIINNNIATSSAKVNVITPTPTPVPQRAPVKACYKYGSKCFTSSDYNQLVNLGYSLSSAQTFYQFHLDGVQRYQDEYDRTKSSVYLDAKASSQQQANRELEKINSITSQMQTIQNRGW